MLWHILGWAVLIAQCCLGIAVVPWLATRRYVPTWAVPVRVPKFIDDTPLNLSPGTDYLGGIL